MSSAIEGLEPQPLWTHFAALSRIPRGSKNEAGAAQYVLDTARRLGLEAPEEARLAKHLLNFGLTIEAVVQEYRPNYLCNYLYELAGHFTAFYEACPVLKTAEPVRSSRLTLCDLTARVLERGLEVLGIETPGKM